MTTEDKRPQEEASPEKHIYRVRAESMCYFFIYVESTSQEEAEAIAREVDGAYWNEDERSYGWEVLDAEESDGTNRDELLPESALNTL